jgi:hypothetical protein
LQKPIFVARVYHGGMMTPTSLHCKNLRFRIEASGAAATLESALATVRRLGIELRGLRVDGAGPGIGDCAGSIGNSGEVALDVRISLAATDGDTLTLCRMRLHNLVGVLTIREWFTRSDNCI